MVHDQSFVSLCENARKRIQETSCETTFGWLDTDESFILIDVREDHEWIGGHLPQAIHLGRGVIERDISKIIHDKKQKIVLYCGGGYRSALAAVSLGKLGFENVYSMSGGLRRWQELSYPLLQEE